MFQLDVIIADLDGGGIHVPEHVQLSMIPDSIYSRMVDALQMVELIYLEQIKYRISPWSQVWLPFVWIRKIGK